MLAVRRLYISQYFLPDNRIALRTPLPAVSLKNNNQGLTRCGKSPEFILGSCIFNSKYCAQLSYFVFASIIAVIINSFIIFAGSMKSHTMKFPINIIINIIKSYSDIMKLSGIKLIIITTTVIIINSLNPCSITMNSFNIKFLNIAIINIIMIKIIIINSIKHCIITMKLFCVKFLIIAIIIAIIFIIIAIIDIMKLHLADTAGSFDYSMVQYPYLPLAIFSFSQ